jgi:hypothetical protein
MRFKVLMVMSMKMAVFWNVVPVMQAAGTSETSINSEQTTQSNFPDDSHLHTHHCEDQKFHIKLYLFALKLLSPLVDLLDIVRCEEIIYVKNVGMC